MEDGFMKAKYENLPKVDAFMIGMFFSNNSDLCSAEFRNAKMSISSRQSYGDDAVGYVQLKRTSTLCTVKAKICPEHKVRQKQYCVTMIVDEKKGEVCSVKCNDCPASEGCCKHSIAFLMWTHRRSEEPARTDIECYWKKSKLAKVGTTLKFITLKNMSSQSKIRKDIDTVKSNHNVFQKFVEEGIKQKLRNCKILKHQPTYEIDPILVLSMHYLSSKFNTENDAGKFMSNIQSVVTQSNLMHVEIETRQQHNSPAWHELRYARITASRAYEVSRCHTSDGSLIALQMGAKVPNTPALDRRRKLESLVKKQVGKQYSAISECGLYISPQYPILAASPDGILNADTVIEIKCPVNEKTFKNYIVEGKVRDRYYAQVQMQMYVTNLKKSLLCVASWDFEKNNEVSVIPLSFNPEYANELVNKLITFWNTNVYPILYKSTK